MIEMPPVILIKEKLRLNNKVQQQYLTSGTLPDVPLQKPIGHLEQKRL